MHPNHVMDRYQPGECPVCTFANEPSMSYCELCGCELKCEHLEFKSEHLEDKYTRPSSDADFLAIHFEEALILDLLAAEQVRAEQEMELPAGTPRCPCCGLAIEIVAVNCRVFVCGATAAGQCDPHAAAGPGLRLGCGGQFRLQDAQLVPC